MKNEKLIKALENLHLGNSVMADEYRKIGKDWMADKYQERAEQYKNRLEFYKECFHTNDVEISIDDVIASEEGCLVA